MAERSQFVSYTEEEAPNGRRYLLCALVTWERLPGTDAWRATGEREPLASFPAAMHASPWMDGVQRHARRFSFDHPATIAWATPKKDA